MLRITIELLPHGDESRKQHLGTIEIANVGGTQTRGNYRVRLSKRGKPKQLWKEGSVNEFPRKRLGRALRATVGGRNGEKE
jgi:hypothetical protein